MTMKNINSPITDSHMFFDSNGEPVVNANLCAEMESEAFRWKCAAEAWEKCATCEPMKGKRNGEEIQWAITAER